MDSFIMVRPTGKPMNDEIGGWTATAMSDCYPRMAAPIPRRRSGEG